MRRPQFVRLLILCVLILPSSSHLVGCAAEPPPNILLIVLDDVSWNDVGAYGNRVVQTPNIDQLAGEGMRFDNAFLTTSSCSPSRASMLTGLYPHSTGAMELHAELAADVPVVTDLIASSAGYWTAAGGKWHIGNAVGKKLDLYMPASPIDDTGSKFWIPILQKRPKDRPFMIWLGSRDAHRPYSASTPSIHSQEDVVVPPFMVDGVATRTELAQYYDEIARADGEVGRVREELIRQGVWDETLVVLVSDNGRPFARSKTMLYDSGAKTPLIVRWPGRVEAGSVNRSLISMVDLAPTLLDLSGVEIPPSMQGRSFAASLANPEVTIRRFVHLERNWHGQFYHGRGVRSIDYLYIKNTAPLRRPCGLGLTEKTDSGLELRQMRKAKTLTPEQMQCFATPRPEEELYDTHADPYSVRNLADDPAPVTALRQMRQELADWSAETGDPLELEECGGEKQITCQALARLKRSKERKRRQAGAS
jgi:N-sulfoglucosamine sulfohydrolase